MKTRKCIQYWLISTVSALLAGLFPLISVAEQGFLPKAQLRTPYSSDIAFIDRYSAPNLQYQIQISDRKVLSNIRASSSSSIQDQIGSAAYKVTTTSQKKLQGQIAGAALMYGIEHFGYAAPLKDGINFIKQKTRYNFGSCGQIRLSTKKLKAHSCLNDQTKIELKSSYKLDSFTLGFKWAL
ncbi:hypothetical protein ACH42_14050 [Endozoicomonas sp. (ex Bugula neritina AB1)]|nr:hypothetical protein ACH42_14050 [Endozoicomonas sp. (ex Bugula neritina AB1)]